MNVLLTGRNSKDIESLIKSLGFEIVTSKPDVVISYGGDGTLLSSERLYPGIPKLPIRDSLVCKKCPDHDEKVLLKGLLEGKLSLKEYKKIETGIFYRTFTALNDFVIRNAEPIHAIRFQVTSPMSSNKLPRTESPRFSPLSLQEAAENLNLVYHHAPRKTVIALSIHPQSKRLGFSASDYKILIGDGIVLSTPFGSTGYFKSVTGETFEENWGLAFNNTTEKIPSLFLKDKDTVAFKLVRGTATLSFDNNPNIFKVDEGSELQFKLSDKTAKIYELESLRCPNCKITRD